MKYRNQEFLKVLCVLACVFSGSFFLSAQDLNLKVKQDFLDIVEPIITRGERKIYEQLPGSQARRYFQSIFWHKRNPTPSSTENNYRKEFFERRQNAKVQFGTANVLGEASDRGRVLILLGEPEEVEQRQLPTSGAVPIVEEAWSYPSRDLVLRFWYQGRGSSYELQEKEKWEVTFEAIRETQVLDRAEPYTFQPVPLALPNLGFTKDIENLAATDRKEINYHLDYYFFRGDSNQTELLVGITFLDASSRGLDVQLSAFDPFEHKVREFKKRFDVVNGQFVSFSVAIEPDQYNLVLRLLDRDGRESIDRRIVDVPPMGVLSPNASSLLINEGLASVPLQGFREPKKFVFDRLYFPLQNHFDNFAGDRIFLMQHFYLFSELPEINYYVDEKLVQPRKEFEIIEGDVIRYVVSVPAGMLNSGRHIIKSVYRNRSGTLVASTANLPLGIGPDGSLLSRSKMSDLLKLREPSSDSATALERVILDPDPTVKLSRMYVFLNGELYYERERSPWQVPFDQERVSISGKNFLQVVAETDKGLLRVEKELKPLVTDDGAGTRLVQVFFNGFDSDLKFVNSLDTQKISVKVDGEPVVPREIRKAEEPITYCFLIDNSFSMADTFETNLQALKRYIEAIRPQDSGYFVTFSDRYDQYLAPSNSKAVLLALAETIELQRPKEDYSDRIYQENKTFLYDATIAAIHSLLQYPGRKAIVMLTDGIGIEGLYKRNGMLSYARENDVVIYSLWIDNNPKLTDDDRFFLQKEKTRAEKVARAIGLTRFFRKKDSRLAVIGEKVRQESIADGMVKILAEESGGFHYRIFRADRSLIQDYVRDIESALANQYVMTLSLPVSQKEQEVDVVSQEDGISIRCKSSVKVRKTNPLQSD